MVGQPSFQQVRGLQQIYPMQKNQRKYRTTQHVVAKPIMCCPQIACVDSQKPFLDTQAKRLFPVLDMLTLAFSSNPAVPKYNFTKPLAWLQTLLCFNVFLCIFLLDSRQ